MEQERFVDIPGFEGLYVVSNLGTVKRLAYKKRIGYGALQPCGERILKHSTDSHGYFKVDLYSNNKKKSIKIHRLIGICFIPNPENKPQLNHINGNTKDNSIENLEWCTMQENNSHKYRVLKWRRIMPTCGNHWNSKTVYSIDKNGLIERFDSIKEAEIKTGAHNPNISKAIKGVYKTAGGRKWFYDKPK